MREIAISHTFAFLAKERSLLPENQDYEVLHPKFGEQKGRGGHTIPKSDDYQEYQQNRIIRNKTSNVSLVYYIFYSYFILFLFYIIPFLYYIIWLFSLLSKTVRFFRFQICCVPTIFRTPWSTHTLCRFNRHRDISQRLTNIISLQKTLFCSDNLLTVTRNRVTANRSQVSETGTLENNDTSVMGIPITPNIERFSPNLSKTKKGVDSI